MLIRCLLILALAAVPETIAPSAQFFAGEWDCHGAFSSGKPIAAHVSFTPVLGGKWLEYHHRDAAPGSYEVLALWPAADTTANRPVVLYDNGGGRRRFLGSGWTTDTVMLVRDSTEPGARPERFTFRATSDSSYWFAWELRRSADSWVVGDSLSCRRVGKGAEGE